MPENVNFLYYMLNSEVWRQILAQDSRICIFRGLKIAYSILLFLVGLFLQAQQYPFWSQYRSNLFMMNPAVAGTREDLDVRMTYRNQWAGFQGAPVTSGASVQGRLMKGKMGLGGFVFQDKIGPFSNLTAALAYAFKIKFKDVALSFGLNGSYNTSHIDPGYLTYQNSQDMAMNNLNTTRNANNFNSSAGIMLYNDRFHIAISGNNMLGTSFTFDKTGEIPKKGDFTTVPHYCLAIGYNYSENPDYVWENNVMALVVEGTPILLDYYLRLHIKRGLFVGAGIIFNAAVNGQVGWTFGNWGQVSYSYDFCTNALASTNFGTHEVKIVFFHSKFKEQRGRVNKEFQHQKFQYLL